MKKPFAHGSAQKAFEKKNLNGGRSQPLPRLTAAAEPYPPIFLISLTLSTTGGCE